jgi:hypothetical protein
VSRHCAALKSVSRLISASVCVFCLQSHGLDAESAQEAGMKEMSEVFKAAGAQVYVPADAA